MKSQLSLAEHLRRWRIASAVATGGLALLLAGCGNDAEDDYVATESAEQTYTTTNEDSRDYTPAEMQRETAAANENRSTLAADQSGQADQRNYGQSGQADSASPYDPGQVDVESQEAQGQYSQTDAQQGQDPWLFDQQQQGQQQDQLAQNQRSQEVQAQAQDEQSMQAASEDAEIRDSAEIALQEEELDVQTREVASGGILLRKTVESDEASETVDLRREDIEIVRLSPEEAEEYQQQGDSQSGEQFAENEIYIPLEREEAQVDTDVQTREVVRAEPQTSTEQQQVSATVRSEDLEIERIEESEEDYAARQQWDDSEAMDQQRSPEDLHSEIMAHLRSETDLDQDQLSQLEIEVQDDNTVILNGSVPDDEIASTIEEEIRNIEGIASVQSNL